MPRYVVGNPGAARRRFSPPTPVRCCDCEYVRINEVEHDAVCTAQESPQYIISRLVNRRPEWCPWVSSIEGTPYSSGGNHNE